MAPNSAAPTSRRPTLPRAFSLLTLAVAPLLLFLPAAAGQGSAADYERAGQLRGLYSGKVFRDAVKPVWFGGGRYFWYRVTTGRDTHEYVLVDAEAGNRRAAFDHEKLAALLAEAGVEARADRLGLGDLRFDPERHRLDFSAGGKRWRLELRGHRLEEHDGAADGDGPGGGEGGLPAYAPEHGPKRSGPNGEDIHVEFVNRTGGAVTLYWLDQGGERRRYGTIEPGARRSQHTYGSHVWLVVDAADKPLAVFEAGNADATAVIPEGGGKERRRRRPDRAGRGRSQRPPRPEGPADRSPDGRWRASVRDHNVILHDLKKKGGEGEHQLTEDGTAEDFYTGRFFFSPDSSKLVVVKAERDDEREIHFVESSPRDGLQPKLHTHRYRKPGDAVPRRIPHLFDLDSGKAIAVEDDLFPDPWRISDIRWEPDSRRFTFLYNQRGHEVLRIVAVDARSGKAETLVEDAPETFVNYSGKFHCDYLDESGEIIWMSERSGWNHLYLFDAKTGDLKNAITSGPWVVRGVDWVDAETRQIGFRAGGIHPGQDPYLVHHCRVDFDGSNLVVLTEGDGNHSIDYSPDRRYFIDTYSRVDQPPVRELRRTADGKLVCRLETADASALVAAGWQRPEPFVAKGRDGETDIHGVIFRPSNFDPKKKYPVVENIYAGPHSAFVPKSFRAYHGLQGIAEFGFIVVKIDGMGTSHRSKEFHDVAWKNLVDAGLPDRVLWIRAAAAKYPYMDTSRVGIYGGSAGGQSALGALLTHGDFYKVAVADCGCHDNRMDKIWWNEQWMGYPVGEHYEAQSNVTLAPNLKDGAKLLLIVGELDRNVDPASTMQVVDALVRADKDFDLLVIPGAGHGAAGTPYGRRRLRDFLVRHLHGVEPRWTP